MDATNTAVVTHSYDGFNRLISSVVGTTATITYTYNAQGIRTSRQVGDTYTQYLLDGGNVVGEITNGTVTTYLRGANLISSGDSYYLYNAHGDVVQLADSTGAVSKTYEYDAFGNEKNPSDTDANSFRYCGEYYDTETGLYYLRARYYDPTVGRFTQEDTHWNTANMIYGDNPQKINEREDTLGLKTYSYAPQILSILQAGNLYVYGVNNPVLYFDRSGKWIGRVHNWVVNDILDDYDSIGMIANSKVVFLSGYVSPRGVKYGMADLVRLPTGEVWEVKRASISMERAAQQLLDYVSNRLQIAMSKGLCIGGSMGTVIDAKTIIRSAGATTYYIAYWDAGNGVVYYDYYTKKSAKLPITANEYSALYAGILFIAVAAGVGLGAKGDISYISFGG